MEQVNSLSLIKRHDGSFFYLVELGFFRGCYKYILVNWISNKLGEPFIIYSHTKRSNLTNIDKEFFDNNLLNQKRLERYINGNNLYIGGIDRINSQPVREFREGIKIPKNYQVYQRNANNILIECIEKDEINSYNIHEFVNRKTIMDFETVSIYTEKDLLNMEEETDYVINSLLDAKRIENKLKLNGGYVGTVTKINGEYKKTSNKSIEQMIKSKKIGI